MTSLQPLRSERVEHGVTSPLLELIHGAHIDGRGQDFRSNGNRLKRVAQLVFLDHLVDESDGGDIAITLAHGFTFLASENGRGAIQICRL